MRYVNNMAVYLAITMAVTLWNSGARNAKNVFIFYRAIIIFTRNSFLHKRKVTRYRCCTLIEAREHVSCGVRALSSRNPVASLPRWASRAPLLIANYFLLLSFVFVIGCTLALFVDGRDDDEERR